MTHPIFVVGPQRSGTRIAAHIISNLSNRIFIDELDYNPDIPLNTVIQAPFLLKSVLEVSYLFPTAEFAFMYRDPIDIVNSMKRIEWYNDYITNPDFYKAYVDHCYEYIDLLKVTLPSNKWFDIQYDTLMQDPLFVKDRSNFTSKQHLKDTPNGPTTWRNDEYLRSIKG